jgi:hypothetical protein
VRALPALLMIAGLACAGANQRGSDRARVATALAGSWSVVLDGGSDGFSARSASGVMTLVANRELERSFPRIGRPTNYGVYDVDFDAWGFAPYGTRPPTVVLGPSGDDSIAILFDTDRPGFALSMTGSLRGDTIRGVWRLEGHGAGRHGSFVMARSGSRAATVP